jgi:hypothetical protein
MPLTFWNKRVVADHATSFKSPMTMAGRPAAATAFATSSSSASRSAELEASRGAGGRGCTQCTSIASPERKRRRV